MNKKFITISVTIISVLFSTFGTFSVSSQAQAYDFNSTVSKISSLPPITESVDPDTAKSSTTSYPVPKVLGERDERDRELARGDKKAEQESEDDEDADLPMGLNVNKDAYLKARLGQIGFFRGWDTAKKDSRQKAIAAFKSDESSERTKARKKFNDLRQLIRNKKKIADSQIQEVVADAQAGYLSKGDLTSLASDASTSGSTNTNLAAAAASAPAGTWVPLGPHPVPVNSSTAYSGRVSAIAVHPTNPNIAYVGTAGGGLYRTLDGGTTWTPLMDSALSLAIGAVTISPSNPSTIFVGTGESTLCGSGCMIGVGLYRIDNADTTPVLSNVITKNSSGSDVFTGRAISRIIVHPTNPNIVFVGTTSGTAGIGSNTTGLVTAQQGVYKSTNAMSSNPTFDKMTIQGINSGRDVTDLATEPGNPARLIVGLIGQSNDGGVYLSTNALDAVPTFTKTLALPDGSSSGRVEFAVNKTGGTVTVYAAAAASSGTVYKSIDGGATFAPGVNNAFCGTQCFYDIGVAVDPTNANNVYVGGNPNMTLGRSTDGGASFIANSTNLHTDTQALAIAPSNPNIMYFGSDGGIWKTTNATTSGTIPWTTLNNSTFSATEFMSLAIHPTDRNFLIGGTQDNGTQALTPSGTWARTDGGDGGFAVIDQNPTNISNLLSYHTYFNSSFSLAGFSRSTSTDANGNPQWDGFYGCGGTSNGISCSDPVLFYAPMVGGPNAADSNGKNTLYFGTTHLYRSANQGTTMTDVSGALSARISSIAISPQDDNIRLVGTTAGIVYLSTTAGATTMTNISSGLPSRYVGRVRIDPNDKNTAYVAFNGFGLSSGQHVWKTTNLLSGSPIWTAAGNGIPDTPVDSFAVNPSNSQDLFAGTDIGVFRSTDAGANWIPFSNGLPRVPVFGLEVSAPNQVVKIATHGRGVWEYSLGTVATCSRVTPDLSLTQANQTGSSGQALIYTLNVTNKDSADCASSLFNVAATGLATGFTSTPNTISLAPGEANTTTITVTSPTTAVNNPYNFTIGVSDANHSATIPATYTVSNTPCTRTAPQFTATSSNNTAQAGQTITYNLSVVNKDSAPGCANSTFTFVSSGVPTGFTPTFSVPSVSLAAGATGSATLNITSPTTATTGPNTFTISANDSALPNHSTSTTVTYNVNNPVVCSRGVPQVTLSPSANTGGPGSTQTYTVSVKNNDSTTTGCANSTFALSSTALLTGFNGSFGNSSLSVAPGQTGTTNFTITYPSSSANSGPNNFTITANDSSVQNHSASSTGTYTLSNICTRSAPTLSLSQSSLSGKAGDTLNYAVQVRNNDSAPGCASSTFAITTSLSSSFAVNAPSVLVAPQTTGTTTLSVTLPSNATNTTTPVSFTITGNDSSASNHSGTTTASYSVSNPVSCTRSAPTVTISPSSQTGAAGSEQTYTVTVVNKDSTTGCTGTSNFALSSSLPSGFYGVFNPTSLNLAPQATGTSSLTVTSPNTATNGNYGFMATATDASVPGHSGSNSSTYTVNNPPVTTCSRQKPTVVVSPSTQNVATFQTVYYTVNVTNNDPLNCGYTNRNFYLYADGLPSGYTMNGNGNVLVAVGPGQTGSNVIALISQGLLGDSTNVFRVWASDAYGYNVTNATFVIGNGGGPVPCTRNAPIVTLSPSSQTGVAGSSQSYTVTVNNRDSSSCASSTFSISTTGLSSGFSPNSPSVTVSPQNSGSATLMISSSSSAPNNTYNFTVTASANSQSGSTTGSFVVYTPPTPTCTRSAPTVSLNPTFNTGASSSTQSYTVSVSNRDSGTGCTSNSIFSLSNSALISGFNPNFSPASLSLAAGQTGTSTFTIGYPANASNSTNSFTISANDSSISGHSGSASGSYTVYNAPVLTCTRSTPTVTLSPTSNTGAAGSSQVYTVTVTNRDSGSGCSGNSIFALSNSALLSGFNATFNPTSVSLGAGAAGNSTMTISYSSSAVNGSNTVTVTANDSSISGHSGSNSATYAVSNPTGCVRQAPIVTATPMNNTISAGQTATYGVTVTNADSPSCNFSPNTRSFTVYAFYLPSTSGYGVNPAVQGQTYTLASGASTTFNFPIYTQTYAAPGTYTFGFYAYPTDSLSSKGFVSPTLTVLAPGTVHGAFTNIPSVLGIDPTLAAISRFLFGS